MVAAGVGDDSPLALGVGQGGDFVVGSAEFEGTDGLLVFGLEVETRESTWSAPSAPLRAGLGGCLHMNSIRCVRVVMPWRRDWAAWRSSKVIMES